SAPLRGWSGLGKPERLSSPEMPFDGTIRKVFGDATGSSTLTAKSSDNQRYKKVIFVVTNLGVAGQQPDTAPGGVHTADLTTASFSYDLAYKGGAAGCGCDTTGGKPAAGALASFGMVIGWILARGAGSSRRAR